MNPIFCLECRDTGWLEVVEFGQEHEPCPHCDTGERVSLEAKDAQNVRTTSAVNHPGLTDAD